MRQAHGMCVPQGNQSTTPARRTVSMGATRSSLTGHHWTCRFVPDAVAGSNAAPVTQEEDPIPLVIPPDATHGYGGHGAAAGPGLGPGPGLGAGLGAGTAVAPSAPTCYGSRTVLLVATLVPCCVVIALGIFLCAHGRSQMEFVRKRKGPKAAAHTMFSMELAGILCIEFGGLAAAIGIPVGLNSLMCSGCP
jgi:hypothetical protein